MGGVVVESLRDLARDFSGILDEYLSSSGPYILLGDKPYVKRLEKASDAPAVLYLHCAHPYVVRYVARSSTGYTL